MSALEMHSEQSRPQHVDSDSDHLLPKAGGRLWPLHCFEFRPSSCKLVFGLVGGGRVRHLGAETQPLPGELLDSLGVGPTWATRQDDRKFTDKMVLRFLIRKVFVAARG